MKIGTLTIDRGDRPRMLAQCKMMIERQTRKPDLEIYVIEPSVLKAVDIVPRFRSGWLHAKESGIDVIVVIESDDWYSKDYVDNMAFWFETNDIDVLGYSLSLYYNICDQTYQTHTHPNRASLYTTVFKTSSLDNFKWPKDDQRFLDISLWKHFNKTCKPILLDSDIGTSTVGIKHNEGMSAGIGHKGQMRHRDKDFGVLKNIFTSPHKTKDMEFYKNFCNG